LRITGSYTVPALARNLVNYVAPALRFHPCLLVTRDRVSKAPGR